MNMFIKSVRAASSGNKESLVKDNIKNEISNIIKEIQLYATEESFANDSLHMTEAENNLCTVIEAMLLHGLKDSFIHRARRVIADIDERPEPSFWAPLLIISHKQIINQITKLVQVTTEIGQCRAWIRIALNDSLFSSYLSIIGRDSSVLKPYYNTYAYVRDCELLDITQRIIEGVETAVDFNLPCNSSLLNTWHLQSLVLAGIWSPTLRSCPVAAGMDIAQSLQSTSAINSETGSLNSTMSFASHSSGIAPFLALNEDEALKIILAKYSLDKKSNTVQQPSIEEENHVEAFLGANGMEANSCNGPSETILGNSLSRKSAWPFSEPVNRNDTSEEPSTGSNLIEDSPPKSMENSYHAVIESYNTLAGSNIKAPDFREILQNFEEKSKVEIEPTKELNVEEIVDLLPLNDVQYCIEPPSLDSCIGTIARELGMDIRNYECASCSQTLGIMYSPNVCAYTGEYFCDKCMGIASTQIPARIIHNWDFTTYRVSIKAYTYLEEIKDQPLIDIKKANLYIYTVTAEMSNLQRLRIQLNFLRDYLYTCREPIIEELQRLIKGKDYMYTHIHKYSISDLVDVRNGSLIQHLETVVNFGINHVQDCWLCSQKGFICEICSKSKVLYPFDLDNVYRCNVCKAVFHNTCLNSTLPCPKCKRKKKSEMLMVN